MERLTGLDASFLYFETPTMHMHVLATIVFDPSTMPGGYSFEKIKEIIAQPAPPGAAAPPPAGAGPVQPPPPGVGRGPRLRPRLPRSPHRLPGARAPRSSSPRSPATSPAVRSTAAGRCGRCGSSRASSTATSRVVAKMHHCTIDGVSGANLMVHLFDLEPEGRAEPPRRTTGSPSASPSDLELARPRARRRAVAGRCSWFTDRARDDRRRSRSFVAARATHGGPGMAAAVHARRGRLQRRRSPRTARSPSRGSPLDDVKAIKNALGDHGQRRRARDLRRARCAATSRRTTRCPTSSLIAAVPGLGAHATRRADGSAPTRSRRCSRRWPPTSTTRSSGSHAIHEANKGAKEEHNAIGADILQNWAEFAAPTTFSLAARIVRRLAARRARTRSSHNLVISNVPGPAVPALLRRREARRAVPARAGLRRRRPQHHGRVATWTSSTGAHRVPRDRRRCGTSPRRSPRPSPSCTRPRTRSRARSRDGSMPLPEEFHAARARVNNWGRWGDDDETGTLNLITDEVVRRAAACVRDGRRFSLAIPLSRGRARSSGTSRGRARTRSAR